MVFEALFCSLLKVIIEMRLFFFTKMSIIGLFAVMLGCHFTGSMNPPVDAASSLSGTGVLFNGVPCSLEGTPLVVGSPIPATYLVDAFSLRKVDISQMKGKVLFLSLVPTLENSAHLKGKVLYSTRMPSLDTRFCEAQTQYLSEKAGLFPENVMRITISRDPPYVQKRFASDANLLDLIYLSDYRDGAFGRSIGLLLSKYLYLARAIIIVDKVGIVKYIQIAHDITHIPDMDKAIAIACQLAGEV